MISSFLLALAAQRAIGTEPASQKELTVYYEGFGVVKELRHVRLSLGPQTVVVSDVPSRIDPTSVAIRSLTAPGSFQILEQNYGYDLLNVESILNKSVGQRIRFVRHFGKKSEALEGTLLSSPTAIVPTTEPQGGFAYAGDYDLQGQGYIPSGNGTGSQTVRQYNGMVVRLDDGRLLLNPTGEVEVLSLPEGMLSRPTLTWNLVSRRAGDNLVELSYIANSMRWTANYVFTLDSATNRGALQGWVSLDNNSGATYKDAKLKLLAGEVHLAPYVPGMIQHVSYDSTDNSLIVDRAKGFAEERLFEYHLYTLQRPATIKDKEIKQLSLLESAKVPYRKRLVIDSLQDAGVYYPGEGEIGGGNLKPEVRIDFVNDEEAGLGIPLPAGKIRLYQRDASGSVQLLGEDTIEHTPKHEKLSIKVGSAFDIVANRKRLSFHWERIHSAAREEFQIEVRNRKATMETVELLERHYGDWKITKSSEPFTKEDAYTMKYTLTLKPDEVRKVTYSVVTRW